MISIEAMKNSVGKSANIMFFEGEPIQGLVESFEYEPGEDGEPMILVNQNHAFRKSEIKDIRIMNK